jgi:hypothetical protein
MTKIQVVSYHGMQCLGKRCGLLGARLVAIVVTDCR